MIYTIHGLKISKGTNRTTNKEFNFVKFYATFTSPDRYVIGSEVKEFIVQRDRLSNYADEDLKKLIGHDVDFEIVPYNDRVVYTGINQVL